MPRKRTKSAILDTEEDKLAKEIVEKVEKKVRGSHTNPVLTAEEFHKNALAETLRVGDTEMIASPKVFTSGAYGWYTCGKIIIFVGDHALSVQINLCMTVVGSKPVNRRNE